MENPHPSAPTQSCTRRSRRPPLLGVADLLRSGELAPLETALEIAAYVMPYEPEREAVVCVANPAWEQWGGNGALLRKCDNSTGFAGIWMQRLRPQLVQRQPVQRVCFSSKAKSSAHSGFA